MKICVGLSGGVDSSVAALLLSGRVTMFLPCSCRTGMTPKVLCTEIANGKRTVWWLRWWQKDRYSVPFVDLSDEYRRRGRLYVQRI